MLCLNIAENLRSVTKRLPVHTGSQSNAGTSLSVFIEALADVFNASLQLLYPVRVDTRLRPLFSKPQKAINVGNQAISSLLKNVVFDRLQLRLKEHVSLSVSRAGHIESKGIQRHKRQLLK